MTDSYPNTLEPSNNLSLATDRYNCYVGELATIFLRFVVPQSDGAFVQLRLPNVMQIETYQLPEGLSPSQLSLSELNEEVILQIPLREPFEAGKSYEISINVRVKTFQIDHYLLSEAELFDADTHLLAYEAVQMAVISRGNYMQHLPEIYERDDFINRFLMLIESFWKPINQQIDQVDCYFDPHLTSSAMLPWLASWMGMSFEKTLPLNRMRALLKSAMVFYQQRGTLQALKTYLEMYTGGEAAISERRARNFVLGEKGRLGVEIALGKNNQPNSLQVDLRVSADELNQTGFSTDMYQRKMKEIVRSLVPAHSVFSVQCEFVENDNVVKAKGI
jgi:phage tail-like protein